MKKEMQGNNLKIHREKGSSDIVTNNPSRSLVNPSIDNSKSKRYNPRQLKKERGFENEGLRSYCKGRKGEEMKNSLMVIQALYKKGLINLDTLSNIEKKYGRLD